MDLFRRSWLAARGLVVTTLLLLAACDEKPAPGVDATASAGASSSAVASASTTASAEPSHPHAGTWKGSFEAAKGEVTIDEGVPYGTWKKEDGKTVAGAGQIELVVQPNGAVSGTTTGALGELKAMGVFQPDGELAVTLQPDDPNAEDAMTGTLVGRVDNDVLKAELRASSRDGNRVRKAAVTLKKLR